MSGGRDKLAELKPQWVEPKSHTFSGYIDFSPVKTEWGERGHSGLSSMTIEVKLESFFSEDAESVNVSFNLHREGGCG